MRSQTAQGGNRRPRESPGAQGPGRRAVVYATGTSKAWEGAPGAGGALIHGHLAYRLGASRRPRGPENTHTAPPWGQDGETREAEAGLLENAARPRGAGKCAPATGAGACFLIS